MRIYYEGLNLTNAIRLGAQAKNPDGKMNSHQRRNGAEKCNDGALELEKNEAEIDACSSFEEIFEIIDRISKMKKRLGPLWSYDTALRIGFNKKLYPNTVYIQSGVKKGLKKAGIKRKGRSMPTSSFPPILNQLKPYQIENFLCVWGKQ